MDTLILDSPHRTAYFLLPVEITSLLDCCDDNLTLPEFPDFAHAIQNAAGFCFFALGVAISLFLSMGNGLIGKMMGGR
jgi:hypothetical protein